MSEVAELRRTPGPPLGGPPTGFRNPTVGSQLLREDAGNLTHFSVLSFWDSRDSIHGYAGADISKVRPLPRDTEFLIDPESSVRNYDLRVDARR